MLCQLINSFKKIVSSKIVRRVFSLLVIGVLFFMVINPMSNKSTCGTTITKAQILYDLNLIAASHLGLNTLETPIRLAVHIHWISAEASDVLSKKLVFQNIDGLNEHFKAIGVGFDIVGFHEHINKGLAEYSTERDREDLEKLLIPRTINIFYADKISIQGSEDYCGFAYYPTAGKDYILIKKDCSIHNSTAIHEMGHFLGLYHTHESIFGKEEEGSKNCSQAGDLICDTPVENMASMLPDDKTVRLPINFMSYGDKAQRTFFSNGQYNKMSEVYCAFKSHLQQTNGGFVLFNNNIYTGNKSKISIPDAKYVEWPDGSCDNEKTLVLHTDTTVELTISAGVHIIHKQIKINVSNETTVAANVTIQKGNSAEIDIFKSNPMVSYRLYVNNEPYGYTHYGNGSTLKIRTWKIFKNTDYKVLVSQPGTKSYFIEKTVSVKVL